MRKKRRPRHIYEEGEKPMKMWLDTKPFVDLFLTPLTENKIREVASRLKVSQHRIEDLARPGRVVSYVYADIYATRMRIPSLHDMG